jgi:hypothetical protein
MRRLAIRPFLLGLALLCASPLAFARDALPPGANGDCRDSVITVPSPAAQAPAKRPASVAARKPKPAAATVHTTGGGGGDEGGGMPRVPRWHSFLPGMFR